MNLLVVRNNGRSGGFIPMELTEVCAGQRVPLLQQTLRQRQATAITRNCAVNPIDRLNNTRLICNAMGIFEGGTAFKHVENCKCC